MQSCAHEKRLSFVPKNNYPELKDVHLFLQFSLASLVVFILEIVSTNQNTWNIFIQFHTKGRGDDAFPHTLSSRAFCHLVVRYYLVFLLR